MYKLITVEAVVFCKNTRAYMVVVFQVPPDNTSFNHIFLSYTIQTKYLIFVEHTDEVSLNLESDDTALYSHTCQLIVERCSPKTAVFGLTGA
jgi:hypothetical protein